MKVSIDINSLRENLNSFSLFAPLSVALEIAENVNKSNIVLKGILKTNLKSSLYLGKRKIKSNLTIFDKNKIPYFYVINYESGGFVIISADKRSIPIVGYSEKGIFNIDSLPLGLVKWFEHYADHIKNLRAMNTQPSEYINYQWESLGCDESLFKSTNLYQCPPPPPPPAYSETTVTVGPLLTTTWGQGPDYNYHCEPASDGPDGYSLTGCVATATAQVMAYWQWPSTYSWISMPPDYGVDATAVLMRDIGDAVGMDYGGKESSASMTAIPGALKNIFNYSSATYCHYDVSSYNTVIANLNNHQPVILSGFRDQNTILGIPYNYYNGHTWVCDGYMQTTYYQNGAETSQYLAFYMNWGADGTYDGFYAFNYWLMPNGYNYQYHTEMIYNIHP